jgi:hypothetical protein
MPGSVASGTLYNPNIGKMVEEVNGGKTVEHFLTPRNIHVIILGSLNRNMRWMVHVAYTIPVCNSRRMWILRGPACSREEDIDLSEREVSCEHISCSVLRTGLRLCIERLSTRF